VKRIIYLFVAAIMIGSGYYINYVYTSVSSVDLAACETAYRQQFSEQPNMAERFIDQCRNPATIIASRANGGDLSAEEAAELISTANRNNLIKTILGFALMGGGIGAVGAAFTRKK
jgi:hypothetical protein